MCREVGLRSSVCSVIAHTVHCVPGRACSITGLSFSHHCSPARWAVLSTPYYTCEHSATVDRAAQGHSHNSVRQSQDSNVDHLLWDP